VSRRGPGPGTDAGTGSTPGTSPEERTYTLRAVQASLGLSRRVLDALVAQGFVTPARGPGRTLRFTFQDLLLLRTAHALQASQVPPRKILRALAQLQAMLPRELPLSGLRLSAVGAEVAVRDRHGAWRADSGQMLMDFEVAPTGASVSFIDRVGAAGARGAAAAPVSAAPPGAGVVPELEAERCFERGVALEAKSGVAAQAAYERSLSLQPGHLGATLNLGALWSESGRHADVVALCDAALASALPAPDSQRALLHFNRAVALDHLERLREAEAAYRRALALDPELADAHYNLARLHEQQGDARGALRHFNAYRRLQR
jgi:tetratricopeptide (TPR) repeat protein